MKALFFIVLLAVVVNCQILSRIELDRQLYYKGNPLQLTWELSSEFEEPLHLLSWGTPLEQSWKAPMFSIVHESGEKAVYTGIVAKRSAFPTEEHFVLLHKGAVHSGVLELHSKFSFRLAGTYRITLEISGKTLHGAPVRITSNTIELVVMTPDVVPYRVEGSATRGITQFINCDASQQAIIVAAVSNALLAVDNALTFLDQSPRECIAEWERWFGTYDPMSSDWELIQNHYLSIYNFFDVLNYEFDCTNDPVDCGGTTIAFVYPGDDTLHTIYLCDDFFAKDPSPLAIDSQPGTLVHEASHFYDVVGTDDNAYGVTECLDLAINSPDLARNNADSHEYFVEEAPFCDQGGGGGDPHILGFNGVDFELDFEDGKKYLFFASSDFQVIIQTEAYRNKMFITEIGVTFHSHHLLAKFNDTEPVFYLDDQLILENIPTPFGEIKVFVPEQDLTGPLAFGNKFLRRGLTVGSDLEIIGGYFVGGAFFNVEVRREIHQENFGLLPEVSVSNSARDVDFLQRFEVASFFE